MAQERFYLVPEWQEGNVKIECGLDVWTDPISTFLEHLTDAQWRKFAVFSWQYGTTIKEELSNILALTIEPEERCGSLSISFRGVPGPGVMLPDGSTHT